MRDFRRTDTQQVVPSFQSQVFIDEYARHEISDTRTLVQNAATKWTGSNLHGAYSIYWTYASKVEAHWIEAFWSLVLCTNRILGSLLAKQQFFIKPQAGYWLHIWKTCKSCNFKAITKSRKMGKWYATVWTQAVEIEVEVRNCVTSYNHMLASASRSSCNASLERRV